MAETARRTTGMAFTDSRQASRGAAPLSFIRRGLARLREHLRAASDARHLLQADDHLLRDVGLTRSDLNQLARAGRPARHRDR